MRPDLPLIPDLLGLKNDVWFCQPLKIASVYDRA
jgi:hypothetical protein